jgi:hypothetical protein
METHHYVFEAMADQQLSLQVTPENSVRLTLYGVDGTVLNSGMGEGTTIERVLPSTQGYILSLSAGEEPVEYSAELVIE